MSPNIYLMMLIVIHGKLLVIAVIHSCRVQARRFVSRETKKATGFSR